MITRFGLEYNLSETVWYTVKGVQSAIAVFIFDFTLICDIFHT